MWAIKAKNDEYFEAKDVEVLCNDIATFCAENNRLLPDIESIFMVENEIMTIPDAEVSMFVECMEADYYQQIKEDM
tara:strand:- start:359 stop:586 length:228 start_codon:yes stop_codon:yes gene_type:complete